MKRLLPLLISLVILIPVGLIGFKHLEKDERPTSYYDQQAWKQQLEEKRRLKNKGYHKLDKPDEFALFQSGIRTKEGETVPGYSSSYILNELHKAKKYQAEYYAHAKTNETNAITWTERGPANVPGRTRALAVLPGDASQNTWIAGSVGGGIWKTTDGGNSWIEKTKDLPNIAFSSIAMAESNAAVLYAGSGEGGLGGADLISGNGLFKSVDGGETWSQLTSTADNPDYQNINRVIVDPTNENIVVICTSNRTNFESGIYKSIDGGDSWTNTFIDNSTSRGIQQIVATPGNFNVQYAASNGEGVWKSVNAGDSWAISNTGMSPNGRLELAVSPVNPNRVFASAEGSSTGSGSDLYISDDAGVNWSLVDVSFSGSAVDYLGGQGWYDNTILCSPYNADVVYLGGVSIVQIVMGSGGSSTITNYNVQENGTTGFMTFVNFGATAFGGALEIGGSANGTSVELRFGPGLSQKAHRFTVPNGAGSGVEDIDYSYQDYVDVPFEVWDVDNNKQLMVSFRDQQKDGVFNLIEQNTAAGDEANHSREYIYINNVDYNATTGDANISTNGGHVFNQMYFFWPVLPTGGTWDSANLPSSTLDIVATNVQVKDATTNIVADPYNQYDGTNVFNQFGVDVHPDQHGMVAIKEDDINKTYRILLSNDGGPFISNVSDNPGINQGDWTMVGKTYNTSQFYGADKKPGEDVYFGGMQDNGTWVSPIDANSSSDYNFKIGGDGFEVIWHNLDSDKLIGGSQFNGFMRSTNGGSSFVSAVNGLSGSAPFISKLATSKAFPDVIYAVSSDGVFKSEDFGGSWALTSINQFWQANSYTFLDVEVSRVNANIVWAGSGISTTRRLHVSIDQGVTFTETNNFTDVPMGTITKIASHPTEPNTAYALFSFAQSPKILKTEDLGQTWVDISGFGTNTTSSNGFPDVAVYSLYVRPDDPNVLWAGTDIGIVESIDNGVSWHLLNVEMPSVAVWDMKGQDNQVVIATHGRGIWTATLDVSQASFKQSPTITAHGTSPQKDFVIRINSTETFDSIKVFVDDVEEITLYNVSPGDQIANFGNIAPGNKQLKFISYLDGAPNQSSETTLSHFSVMNSAVDHSNFMETPSDFVLDGLQITSFESTQNNSLQSPHDYSNDSDLSAILRQPIIVSGTNSTFNYEDIALVEPGNVGSTFGETAFNDYVVVEATKDGLTWVPIEDGYDADFVSKWRSAFESSATIEQSLYQKHSIDLTNKFTEGDTLLFRFRLFSDAQTTGWGWSVDNLYMQTEPLGIEESTDFSSYSVYPVPSKGDFTIDYHLESSSNISIDIVDANGKKLKTYNLGNKPVGPYRFKFENSTLENGIYLFILKSDKSLVSRRVVVSK